MWIARKFKLFQHSENPSSMLSQWSKIQENPSGQYQQVIARKIHSWRAWIIFPAGQGMTSRSRKRKVPRAHTKDDYVYRSLLTKVHIYSAPYIVSKAYGSPTQVSKVRTVLQKPRWYHEKWETYLRKGELCNEGGSLRDGNMLYPTWRSRYSMGCQSYPLKNKRRLLYIF